jgi:integrase
LFFKEKFDASLDTPRYRLRYRNAKTLAFKTTKRTLCPLSRAWGSARPNRLTFYSPKPARGSVGHGQIDGIGTRLAKHVKANESIKHWALSTQRKQVLYVKALFHYLVHTCKEISEDPTRYLNMHRYVTDKTTQKNTFKKTEIQTLFDRTRMSQLDNPLHYFGPLFAFYTGMRCNEIAQLLVENIQLVEMLDEDGNPQSLYCIEVTDKGKGQSVKSAYSKRWLP